MQCKNCGEIVNEDALFCDQCGQHLYEERQDEIETETETATPSIENIDRNPSFYEDMLIFVDKHNAFYEKKWQMMEEKNKVFSFNLAALILSIFWLGYRKMYKNIFLIILFLLFTDLVLYLSGYTYNFDFPVDPVYLSIYIAVAIFIGFYGNRLYKNYTNKNVALIRGIKGNTPKGKYALFRSKGGGARYGPLLALVIFYTAYGITTQFIPVNLSPVDQVKYSYYVDPDETFIDVFDDIFVDGKWIPQEQYDTYDIIDHHGKAFFNGETHDVTIRFHNAKEDLEILYVAIDGDELDQYDSYEFLDDFFAEHGYAYEIMEEATPDTSARVAP